MTKDTWTAKHEEAALLVAEDKLTDVAIAERLGVSKRTLEDWKRDPFFRGKLDEMISDIRATLMRHGIARLDRRLARLNKTWNDLQAVIEARAEELAGEAAGAETGLIVLQEKGVGNGDNFRVLQEYVVDPVILSELRALEMQAAKELGQWIDKKSSDLTTGGKPLAAGPDLRGLPTERLKLLQDILTEAELIAEGAGDGDADDSA